MFQRCFTLERRSTGKTMKKIERVFHWNTTAGSTGGAKPFPNGSLNKSLQGLPSEEDSMFEDAEAREQDMKF